MAVEGSERMGSNKEKPTRAKDSQKTPEGRDPTRGKEGHWER